MIVAYFIITGVFCFWFVMAVVPMFTRDYKYKNKL